MREMWVQFLDWEDPLEKEIATHSSILAWETPWKKEPRGATVDGLQDSGTWLSDWTAMHSAVLSIKSELRL